MKINLMIKEKIKFVEIIQKYKISHYKIEELKGISPQSQRYWIKVHDKMKVEYTIKLIVKVKMPNLLILSKKKKW